MIRISVLTLVFFIATVASAQTPPSPEQTPPSPERKRPLLPERVARQAATREGERIVKLADFKPRPKVTVPRFCVRQPSGAMLCRVRFVFAKTSERPASRCYLSMRVRYARGGLRLAYRKVPDCSSS